MYYVYILESLIDGSYYIGHTGNLEVRLAEHNDGREKYTRLKKPWKLVYKEEFSTRGEADKREKYLKRMKSRVYLDKLIEGLGL